jgi:hypothetical protein
MLLTCKTQIISLSFLRRQGLALEVLSFKLFIGVIRKLDVLCTTLSSSVKTYLWFVGEWAHSASQYGERNKGQREHHLLSHNLRWNGKKVAISAYRNNLSPSWSISDVDTMLVCISLGRFFTYLKNLWLEKRKIELSQFQFHTSHNLLPGSVLNKKFRFWFLFQFWKWDLIPIQFLLSHIGTSG